MKMLKVKLEYWLPGITIEVSGARQPVGNGNRTEWSPVRSVINKNNNILYSTSNFNRDDKAGLQIA